MQYPGQYPAQPPAQHPAKLPLPLPKAVILDMDGLLLDSEKVSRHCYRLALVAFGVIADAGAENDSQRLADAHYPQLIGLPAPVQRQVLKRILPAKVNVAEFDGWWRRAFRQHLSQSEGVEAKAGAHALCRWLAGQGVALAVATSTHTDLARSLLDRVGLLGYIKAVVGGDQVAKGKPSPDLYLRAAEAVGVAAGECLAFEDSPPGIRAAHAANMPVVHVPDVVAADEETKAMTILVAESLLAAAGGLGWEV